MQVLKRGDKRRQVQQLLARVSWQGTNKHTSGPAPAGLGRLPATITSVQSTLLFNSKENPYKVRSVVASQHYSFHLFCATVSPPNG